jgi:hypothetical protein
MIPFLIIVCVLDAGVKASIASQLASARGLIRSVRTLTIKSWCFHPPAFVLPM